SGLGFESQCVHSGHPSAGGCQRSTGDPRLIIGKGYRLIVLRGYGRTDPLLNKLFYPNASRRSIGKQHSRRPSPSDTMLVPLTSSFAPFSSITPSLNYFLARRGRCKEAEGVKAPDNAPEWQPSAGTDQSWNFPHPLPHFPLPHLPYCTSPYCTSPYRTSPYRTSPYRTSPYHTYPIAPPTIAAGTVYVPWQSCSGR
ncbi:unnamed protein product, partial [Closterium sp. NIES-54]